MSEQFTREERAKTYPGAVFLHYKGGIYRALMDAKHTETGEQMVIYEHLYPHPHSHYARPLVEFFSNVELEDGTTVPRFKPIGAYAQAFKDKFASRGWIVL